MRPRDDEELDRSLRTAFEPDATTVERVVAAAMRQRPRKAWIPRLATASLLAAVAIVALILWPRSTSVRAQSVRLEYVGNVAILEYPDGSSCLMSSDANDKGPQIPVNLILVEGDVP